MSLKNYFIYVFLALISVIVIINKHYYVFSIVILFAVFMAFKKYGIAQGIILILVCSFFLFYKVNKKPTIENLEIKEEVSVIKAKEKYLIVKKDSVDYLIYLDNEDGIYQKGNILYIEGSIKEITKDLELDTFEFADYLKNQRVYYEIEPINYEIVSSDITIQDKIINALTFKLEDDAKAMTLMLLFNKASADIDSYNTLKEINAMHLFVVSGFHISFLFSLLLFIFQKKEKISVLIFFVLGLCYIYILNFAFSATRAFISLILAKIFKDKLGKLDTLIIPSLLYLFFEPLIVFNYSFILTNTMVLTITLTSNFTKNKILKPFISGAFCFLASLPIQLIMNYEINIISLLTNIFLSYVVMVIFVCTLIGIPLSFISPDFFSVIYRLFKKVINYLACIDSKLLFGSMPLWLLLIYYVLFVLFILFLEKKNKKGYITLLISMGLLLFGLYNRQMLNPIQSVTYLNVYQGDCSIIIDSFNGGVMLIDTGGLQNYDIATKKIIPYLRYRGIRHIDKVLITHDDYDHCGALDSLLTNIQVYEVIKDNTISDVSIGKIKFKNLNTYAAEYDDENNQSIVLYGKIGNNSFLFMGDASTDIEKRIIADNTLSVDFLKVGHHGSKSSTCDEFIKAIKPKYGIISVGENNYYGHPHQEVLTILEDNDVIVYQTSINGTIRYSYFFFDYYFIKCAK